MSDRTSDDRAFWRGMEAGEFPGPQTTGPASVTLTTGRSRWLGMRCTGCRQTFRRGDRVRVTADGQVHHLLPALRCPAPDESQDAEQDAGVDAGVDARAGAEWPTSVGTTVEVTGSVTGDRFAEGLESVWPAPNNAPVFRLTEQDWQVTRPTSGPTTPTCPGCGHTFRAGDKVIICPCAGGPEDPRRTYCQVTVHRDPAQGLTCWDDWAPSGRLRRCPRTLETGNP